MHIRIVTAKELSDILFLSNHIEIIVPDSKEAVKKLNAYITNEQVCKTNTLVREYLIKGRKYWGIRKAV